MKNDSPILEMKSYRHIRIRLKELLEERHLTRGYLARMTNTRFEVIDKWCSGTLEKIDADVLARICFVLSCKVEDILEEDSEEAPLDPPQES